MITVILTFIVFTGAIVLLTALIAAGENLLVKKGPVKIIINGRGDEPLVIESGRTLLNTLTSQQILLPSACGGKGTCGTCRCRIIEGCGELLPTEAGYITGREAKDHWRLACQVKVNQDMRIEVPEEIFSIKKWDCEVVSNDCVATFIKEFVVRLPNGENLDFKAGGYIQIEIPPYEIDFSKDVHVPDKFIGDWDRIGCTSIKMKNSEDIIRAYSMANHPAEGNIIKLNVRIATPPWDPKTKKVKKVPAGISSSYIFSKKPGDTVTISGPYGEFFVQETKREMIYIGGGAGMAPLRSHIFDLFHTKKTKRKVSYWYGARSLREVFYEPEFRAIEKKNKNFRFNLAMSEPLPEDKWKGYTGFIHRVLYDEYLKNHPAPEDIEYYLCGPPMMIDAVLAMLDSLGVDPEMIRYDKF